MRLGVTANASGAGRAPTRRDVSRRGVSTRRVRGASGGTRAMMGEDDDDAQKVKSDADDAGSSKPASYYAGMLTEPVAPGAVDPNERDVMTPTIKLVGRSAVVLTALTLGFLASNGLPPFDR